MKQDGDFFIMLPSTTNLFPTNSESYYRVALRRQIHLKDEEDWEVGLHHVIYPFSRFEVPHECDHPQVMFRPFGSQNIDTLALPAGRYSAALDVVEGLLQCMNKPRHPWYFNIVVDDEWNVTLLSQDLWIMVATPVAQALGWITSEKKRRINALGLKKSPSLTLNYGFEWWVLPLGKSITFAGTFVIPLTVSLCQCKHRVVQVQTNLIG